MRVALLSKLLFIITSGKYSTLVKIKKNTKTSYSNNN